MHQFFNLINFVLPSLLAPWGCAAALCAPFTQDVLWRQKEQFSDGVGYDWVDSLGKHAEAEVTDEMFAARFERFPPTEYAPIPPTTKEYYLLRSIFEVSRCLSLTPA